MAGRANLIKMVWLPQLLYLLHNSPVWIGEKWFQKIQSLFRKLIWKKGQARIGLQKLQCPTTEGGLGVPHPFTYFLAAQLQQLGGCAIDGGGSKSAQITLQGSPHSSLVEALEAESLQGEIPKLKMITRVWQTTKRIMGYKGTSEYSPIWNNKNLQELLSVDSNKLWERCGISRLIQIYEGDTLKSFEELKYEYGMPNRVFYTYLQIRHALSKQFDRQPPIWCRIPLLQTIIKSESSKGLISEIYTQLIKRINMQVGLPGGRVRWAADGGEITDAEWKRILEFGTEVSVSPSHKASHLMLLHRSYYTPKKLFMFGRRINDECPRCRRTGDLIHMVWRCPKLVRYWSEILKKINITFKTNLELDSKTCVLGHVGDGLRDRSTAVAVARCLFQARKLIAQLWQSKTPPTSEDWIGIVNSTVWSERTFYTRAGNYNKFVRLWNPWVQAMPCPQAVLLVR